MIVSIPSFFKCYTSYDKICSHLLKAAFSLWSMLVGIVFLNVIKSVFNAEEKIVFSSC